VVATTIGRRPVAGGPKACLPPASR